MKINFFYLLVIFAFSRCISDGESKYDESNKSENINNLTMNEKKTSDEYSLIDTNATTETVALYKNLSKLAKTKILFGHQDDIAYGVNWWAEEGRSDVKDVTGAYPALFGWELGEIGSERNIDSILFTDMKRWIEFAYNQGAVNTISWHMINPVTKENSWDTTKAVFSILKGGENHEFFIQKLQLVGNFIKNLKGKNGEAIPIIFRPWHEHLGSWFWWGGENRTEEEYSQLFRFTVEYFRDTMDIHNLIYVYSPDSQSDTYLAGYPGDDYADILGLDMYSYGDVTDESILEAEKKLETLCKLANKKGKIAAFSETGREGLKPADWFTRYLLTPLKRNPIAAEIAYVMVWRNANTEKNKDHFYVPYTGHESVDDFLKFKADSMILFKDNMPAMY